jgi:hypothetical protein
VQPLELLAGQQPQRRQGAEHGQVALTEARP